MENCGKCTAMTAIEPRNTSTKTQSCLFVARNAATAVAAAAAAATAAATAQGRSNGLKGGGTPKFRLAPSALAWTLPGIFQPKYLYSFCASKLTNGNFLQIISVLDKMKGICKLE